MPYVFLVRKIVFILEPLETEAPYTFSFDIVFQFDYIL